MSSEDLNFMNTYGVLEPYNNIKVDNFTPYMLNGRLPSNNGSTIHILSHMHEDHVRGLPGVNLSGNAKYVEEPDWDYGIIYCHVITYRLMVLRWP